MAQSSTASHSAPLTTADGTSLKQSLNKSLRNRKITALLLVLPLFLFILLTFLMPIYEMLSRGVDNNVGKSDGKTHYIATILPTTIPELAKWDATSSELPNEEVFKAFIGDAKKAAKNKTISRVGRRLNFEKSGM